MRAVTVVLLAAIAIIASAVVASASPSHHFFSNNNNDNDNAAAAPSPFLNFTIELPIVETGRVRVNWQSPPGGDISQDWIGLWWTPFKGTYWQFKNVTSSSGSHTFNVLNARHSYNFQYFRGDTKMMQTAEFYPELHVPHQLRLTFVDGNDPTKMRISWTCDRVSPNSVVLLGESPSKLTRVFSGPAYINSTTYTKKELNDRVRLPPIPTISEPFKNIGCRCLRCGHGCYNDYTSSKIFVEPGVFLNVVVDKLVPGKKYYYQVGEHGGHMSGVRSFLARLPAGGGSQQQQKDNNNNHNNMVSVLFVADGGIGFPAKGEPDDTTWDGFSGSAIANDPPSNGANYVWKLITQRIAQNDVGLDSFHFALFVGDISYARGWPAIWEHFHHQTSHGFIDRLPTLYSMGNHEQDFSYNNLDIASGGDSGGEAGVVAGKRFSMNKDSSHNFLEYGPVAVVMLDSESVIGPQKEYLRSVLSTVDRKKTPWVIATAHRPFYTSATLPDSTWRTHMQEYEDLFHEFNVNVVLSGHQHYYERIFPTAYNAKNTWGFRSVYDIYKKSAIVSANQSQCYLGAAKLTLGGVNACRVECNKNKECTGVQILLDNFACQLLKCTNLGDVMTYDGLYAIHALTRLSGTSPIYILDGTAGAEFSYPLPGVNKDLIAAQFIRKWGYSDFRANATHFHWRHWEISGALLDEVVLTQ